MRLAIVGFLLASLPVAVQAKMIRLENYVNLVSYSTQYASSIYDFELGAQDASGDFTGDGINDLIYSDPNNSALYKRAGIVRILPGSLSLFTPSKTDLAVVYKGQRKYESQGVILRYIGDINGDGYDDVFTSGTGFFESYVLFGQADPAAAVVTEVQQSGGESCCFLPIGPADVNGDGQDDLVLFGGSYADDAAAYILYGPVESAVTLNVPEVANVTIPGVVGSRTYSRSTATDLNADGYDDLVLTADGIYQIVFGSTDLPTTIDEFVTTIRTKKSKNELTDVLAGDVNGDGHGDLIFRKYDTDSYYDQYYLLLGQTNWSSDSIIESAAITVMEYNSYDHDGIGQPAALMDINADGLDDIIAVDDDKVGSHHQYGSGYIIPGRVDWPAQLTTDHASRQFIGGGMYRDIPAITVGDVNGDQRSDLILGSPYYQAGKPARLYLVLSQDSDQDGFTGLTGDCDDSDTNINPAERDDTGDLVNNDCDAYTDEDVTFSRQQNGSIRSIELLSYQQLIITYADGSIQSIALSEYGKKSNQYYNAFQIANTKYIAIMDGDETGENSLYIINGYSGKKVARVQDYVSPEFQASGIYHLAYTRAHGQALLIGAVHYEVGAGDYYFPTEVYLFSVDEDTGQIAWRDTVVIDRLYRQVQANGKRVKLLIKEDTVAKFMITEDLQLEQIE